LFESEPQPQISMKIVSSNIRFILHSPLVLKLTV
jgi:hypothetical protein